MIQTWNNKNVRVSFPGHCLCGTDHKTVLLNFLQDFSVDGNRLLLQTWGSAGTSDTGTSKKDVVTSDPVAVDVSFLGVFNVRGDQRHLHIDSMFHPAGRLHRAWILGDLGVVVRQNSLHRQNSRRQSEW